MAQQPFSVQCGTCHGTPITCPARYGPYVDVDSGGHAVVYTTTTTFVPCNAPSVTIQTPPAYPATWNPGIAGFGATPDAAHPPNTSGNGFTLPLPPHCWGWEGASDYKQTTQYSLANTLLTILQSAGEYPFIQSFSITMDYDVRTVRRFSRRKVIYTYTDFPTTPYVFVSDTCSDLSSSDTTVHHSSVIFTSSNTSGHIIPVNPWNCVSLSSFPLLTAAGGAVPALDNHQNSTYFDSSVASTTASTWGGFATTNTITSFGTPTVHEVDYIYEFGRETLSFSNVVFTVTVNWTQYKCAPVLSGGTEPPPPPCDCNNTCPPCGDPPTVPTGRCTNVCVDGGNSPSQLTGWLIFGPGSSDPIASSATPNGWSFALTDTCRGQICVPCYTEGDSLGPYSAFIGSSSTCTCPGEGPQYLIYGVTFNLSIDVRCAGAVAGANPWNYEDKPGIGHYHATAINAGNGVYSRGFFRTPSGGWDVDTVTVAAPGTGQRVSDLRVIRDHRDTLLALYCLSNTDGSSPNVYLKTSDDDGRTWSSATMAISGGKHPTVAVANADSPFKTVVIAAYTSGTITGQVKHAGDSAFGTAFTFKDSAGANLSVADDTFHIQQAPESAQRWILHVLLAGGTTTSHFASGDDCRTWETIT